MNEPKPKPEPKWQAWRCASCCHVVICCGKPQAILWSDGHACTTWLHDQALDQKPEKEGA